MEIYQVETQERYIVDVVSDNVKRYMKVNKVPKE